MVRRALLVALCAACGGGQHATTAAPAPVRATTDAATAAEDASVEEAGVDAGLAAGDDGGADAARGAWHAKLDALPFTQHAIFAPQPIRPLYVSSRQPYALESPAVAQILSLRSSDGFTPERLHMFIVRHRMELDRCMPLTKDGRASVQKAEIKLRFGIDATGRTVDVEAEPPTEPPGVAACVARAFEHASFVAPPVPLVAVEVAIRLDARPVVPVPEHTSPGGGGGHPAIDRSP